MNTDKDLAFHFNPRFNEGGRKVIVRNSCIGQRWGQEERELGNFPFVPGQPFEVKSLFPDGTELLPDPASFGFTVSDTSGTSQPALRQKQPVNSSLNRTVLCLQMKILCTSAGFKVAVNNAHLLEFKHRITDLRAIKTISIYNDLTLSRVEVQTLQ